MSLARRIIPCLDTDGSRVVKGVNFVGLRDAGDPAELAARYNAEGADELVVLDIAASRDRRPTFIETIRRVAAELSIPLTAGGGIRSLDDARVVILAGADKVTVNTAAVARPELISELSREFGAQAVVLAIDAKRINDHWDVTIRGGREAAHLDAIQWAQQSVALGAGEILLTSVDRDGTQLGFDVPSLPRSRVLSPSRSSLPAAQNFPSISRRSFPKAPPTPLSPRPSFTTTFNPSANSNNFSPLATSQSASHADSLHRSAVRPGRPTRPWPQTRTRRRRCLRTARKIPISSLVAHH